MTKGRAIFSPFILNDFFSKLINNKARSAIRIVNLAFEYNQNL